jgi:hypothetical protein
MLRRCVSPRLIEGDPTPSSADTASTVQQGRSRRSQTLQELRQQDSANTVLFLEEIQATYGKHATVNRRSSRHVAEESGP